MKQFYIICNIPLNNKIKIKNMNYIGALTAIWTTTNMKNKEISKKVKIPNLVICWWLFCLGFAITYLLLK